METYKPRRQSLRQLHFAQLLTDTEDGCTYGEVWSSPLTSALKGSPSAETSELWSDDALVESESQVSAVEIEITKDVLPPADEAKLLGHEYKDGMIVKKSNDSAPFFAVMAVSEVAKDSYELVCYPKVKFVPTERDVATRGKTPEYRQQTLKGTGAARICDGAWEFTRDKKESGGELTAEDITAWFASVPGASNT